MNETLRADIARPDEQGDLSYVVCAQFLLMHLACLLVFLTGVSAAAVAVCLALYVVRMFAITAGFHRLFSHRSYKTGRLFQFLLAFVGTASGSVAKNILATISCAISYPSTSVYCVVRNFLQHYHLKLDGRISWRSSVK